MNLNLEIEMKTPSWYDQSVSQLQLAAVAREMLAELEAIDISISTSVGHRIVIEADSIVHSNIKALIAAARKT